MRFWTPYGNKKGGLLAKASATPDSNLKAVGMHDAILRPASASIRPQLRSVRVQRINQVKTAAELPATARLLLRNIIDYLADGESCWPSMARLASECGLSVRHARRLMHQLCADGWLSLTPRRRSDGGQTSSLIGWQRPLDTPRTSASATPRTSASAHEKASEENPKKKHDALGCGLTTDSGDGGAADPPVATPAPAAAPEHLSVPLERSSPLGESATVPSSLLIPERCQAPPDTAPAAKAQPVALLDPAANYNARSNLPDSDADRGPATMAELLARLPRPAACVVENASIDAFPPATPDQQSAASAADPGDHHDTPPAIPPQRTCDSAAAATPAIRSKRWLTINPERVDDARHAVEVYRAAVAGGLLKDAELMRLSFLACWCEAVARHRAGKVRSPASVIRWLLQNPRLMAEYAGQRSEDKARRLLPRLF